MPFGNKLRMRADCLVSNHGKRVGTFCPTSWFVEKRNGLKVKSITNGQWFTQPCLCNVSSINIQKDGVQRTSGLVNIRGFCETNVPGNGMNMEVPYLSSMLSPMHHFLLAISEVFRNWGKNNKYDKRCSHDFLGGPMVKNPQANAGDTGWIPGPGRIHMLWGN